MKSPLLSGTKFTPGQTAPAVNRRSERLGIAKMSTMVPLWVKESLRFVLRGWRRVVNVGRQRHCPLCGAWLRFFLPYGHKPRPDVCCPVCHSLERHRLIWLFLQQRTSLLDGQARSLLHIAPEPELSRLLSHVHNLQYLSADLAMPRARLKMDITRMPLPSDSFDVIICCEVLQNIPDDAAAMSELLRVLKPGGWAVLHENIKGDCTVENPEAVTGAERLAAFGLPEYVRRYGRDFKSRLERQGFAVQVLPFGSAFDVQQRKLLGLHDEYDLYYCSKPALQC